MTITNRAVLTFDSDTAKIVRLTIPRADFTKTAAATRAAMEAIINTGIVTTTQGMPLSVLGAEHHSTQRTNLIPGA